ncbi:DNA-binding protein [Tamlana nanhaiensis]|uniref:DNA-binding protein n=1 Tax=Neotamlana nanhaiensis TaxID=1382798 RepID=A0A0D7W2H8_9FLAO|nr:helix-turn-helix transcriptional regulator [Tamlana nanhaiensis]KJD32913.1 DNA-binding protein [Tamlana nanhaiensis]
MINNENFIKRLQKVIEYYGESASSFAEKIGVQRSSISHILSGRNKPSLDFILKILHTYPEINLYWLFNGKGEFFGEDENKSIKKELPKEDLFSANYSELEKKQANINTSFEEKGKTIERIVIFYTDGTFKNFNN